MLAATTEGKARLDALRAQFAALSSAQAAITGARRDHSQALRGGCSCSAPAARSSRRCC